MTPLENIIDEVIFMNKKKDTGELKEVLGKTHISDMEHFFSENANDLLNGDRPFADYFREVLKTKSVMQKDVFLLADIPEKYGYKLISEEKRTKQRDVILRLCYAATFTLDETQKALKLYELPELYPRIPRDALIMVCFNERPGSIIDVNHYLMKNKMDPLRTSGVQE